MYPSQQLPLPTLLPLPSYTCSVHTPLPYVLPHRKQMILRGVSQRQYFYSFSRLFARPSSKGALQYGLTSSSLWVHWEEQSNQVRRNGLQMER